MRIWIIHSDKLSQFQQESLLKAKSVGLQKQADVHKFMKRLRMVQHLEVNLEHLRNLTT